MTMYQKSFYTVKELRELLAGCHDQMHIMVGDTYGGLFDIDMEVGLISLDPNYEEEQELTGDTLDVCDDNYIDF